MVLILAAFASSSAAADRGFDFDLGVGQQFNSTFEDSPVLSLGLRSPELFGRLSIVFEGSVSEAKKLSRQELRDDAVNVNAYALGMVRVWKGFEVGGGSWRGGWSSDRRHPTDPSIVTREGKWDSSPAVGVGYRFSGERAGKVLDRIMLSHTTVDQFGAEQDDVFTTDKWDVIVYSAPMLREWLKLRVMFDPKNFDTIEYGVAIDLW